MPETNSTIRTENWKPVVGFENVFSISDMGKVMRIGRGRSTKIGRIIKGSNHLGYARIELCGNKKSRVRAFIHTLVMEAFVGKCQDGYQVNHINANKMDNRWPENLEYLTQEGNMKHAWGLGIMNPTHGEKHHSSKLTEDEVREILRATGKHRLIAAKFGVRRATISYIKIRKTWKHVSL